jgi:hypothetical protein
LDERKCHSRQYQPLDVGIAERHLGTTLLQGFSIGLNRRFIYVAQNENAISKRVFEQQLIVIISDLIRLYRVRLQLNIPIRNRVTRADAARHELQYRPTEVRMDQLASQVRLQVGNARIVLRQAKSSYETAAEARKLQGQALEAERARFEQGVDAGYILIQYERDYAQSRSAEITALGAYAKAKAALERAVGVTLQGQQRSD